MHAAVIWGGKEAANAARRYDKDVVQNVSKSAHDARIKETFETAELSHLSRCHTSRKHKLKVSISQQT